MQIYTGTCGGENLKMLREYGLGICLSGDKISKDFSEFPCFVDNNAYMAWQRGMPWSESRYFKLLDKIWDSGITADFLIIPDIPCQGIASLEFSLNWIMRGCLRPARLYLAVQDGMTTQSVLEIGSKYFNEISGIFLGGSDEFKKQAKAWCDFAHRHNKKFHYARCGTLANLNYAKEIGADSVDSVSFVRNQSWHILDEFLHPQQEKLNLDIRQEEEMP